MEIPTITNSVLSKVHLIGGEKGGVGKSMMSRLLAQYFIDNQIPFIGFDDGVERLVTIDERG